MSASLKVLKSAGLLFGIQLVQRGLGIVSTLVLARLLAPEHFGIVALVTIALQFFELLVETGNQQYIVQKDTRRRSQYGLEHGHPDQIRDRRARYCLLPSPGGVV